MRVEPQLQQLTGEYLQHSTASGNEVRLDISARGFWQPGQMASQTLNDMQIQNSPRLMKPTKKRKREHITNALFRSSTEVPHLSECRMRNEP